MNIYDDIISKVIVMILVYLILNRALGNLRYRLSALIVFIFGIVLGSIFIIAYILDLEAGVVRNQYDYLVYIITNFVFAIASIIYAFTRYRKNDFVKYNYNQTRNYEPTSKVHYKKFLYLVFEYKNEYLFKKHKENYSGVNIALKKGNFHDVEINKLLKQHSAENSKVTLYGEYTDTQKKEIYYVYLINLDKSISIKKHEFIYYSKIRFIEMENFDKELVYRVLIKEKFNIEK